MIRLLLFTFLLLACSANSQGMISFQENGRYGYQREGLTVIVPTYDYAFDFTNNLGLVKFGEKWGYINELNHAVIPYKFDKAQLFNNNTAEVIIEGKMALIDTLGNFIIEPENEVFYADYSGNGYTIVNNGKKGYVPINRNYLVPCNYEKVHGRKEYANALREDGLWDVYAKGKMFLEGVDNAMYYRTPINGFFFGVYSINGKFGVSQMGGDRLVEPNYYKAKVVSNYEDRAMFILRNILEDGSVGIYLADINGELINQTPYSETGNMDYGNGFVRANGKVGYIKNYGEHLIEPVYDSLIKMATGYIAKKNGKYGLIDSTGNTLVPFSNDDFKVVKNETNLYDDEYGEFIGYETVMEVILLKTGKKSAIYFPISGTYMKPKNRGEVNLGNEIHGAYVKKNGKVGLITENLIIPPTYDTVFMSGLSSGYLMDGKIKSYEYEFIYWGTKANKYSFPHFMDEREELEKYPLELASAAGGLHFKDGKAALYSARHAKLVTDYIFTGARISGLDHDYAILNLNGKFCLYTYAGQEVLPPIYDAIEYYTYQIARVTQGEESYLLHLGTLEKYIEEWRDD